MFSERSRETYKQAHGNSSNIAELLELRKSHRAFLLLDGDTIAKVDSDLDTETGLTIEGEIEDGPAQE
jgi:hypothetical protein